MDEINCHKSARVCLQSSWTLAVNITLTIVKISIMCAHKILIPTSASLTGKISFSTIYGTVRSSAYFLLNCPELCTQSWESFIVKNIWTRGLQGCNTLHNLTRHKLNTTINLIDYFVLTMMSHQLNQYLTLTSSWGSLSTCMCSIRRQNEALRK